MAIECIINFHARCNINDVMPIHLNIMTIWIIKKKEIVMSNTYYNIVELIIQIYIFFSHAKISDFTN